MLRNTQQKYDIPQDAQDMYLTTSHIEGGSKRETMASGLVAFRGEMMWITLPPRSVDTTMPINALIETMVRRGCLFTEDYCRSRPSKIRRIP